MVTWKSDACASNSSRWGPDTVTDHLWLDPLEGETRRHILDCYRHLEVHLVHRRTWPEGHPAGQRQDKGGAAFQKTASQLRLPEAAGLARPPSIEVLLQLVQQLTLRIFQDAQLALRGHGYGAAFLRNDHAQRVAEFGQPQGRGVPGSAGADLGVVVGERQVHPEARESVSLQQYGSIVSR